MADLLDGFPIISFLGLQYMNVQLLYTIIREPGSIGDGMHKATHCARAALCTGMGVDAGRPASAFPNSYILDRITPDR